MVRISLNEEVSNEMLSVYTDSIEVLNRGTEIFFGQMVEIYNRHNYKPLHTVTKQLAEYWANEVNEHITKEVNNWIDSEASIENILRNMVAFDDESNETQKSASSLQASLLEQTKTLFNQEFSLPSISESISMEKDLNQIFEDFQEATITFKQIVSNESEQLKEVTSTKEEENDLYKSWGYLIEIVFSALELHVDNINKQLDTTYEEIAKRTTEAQSIGQESAVNLNSSSKSQVIDTDFSAINHLFTY